MDINISKNKCRAGCDSSTYMVQLILKKGRHAEGMNTQPHPSKSALPLQLFTVLGEISPLSQRSLMND